MSIQKAEKILSLQLEWIKAADVKIPAVFAINIAMIGVIVALIKALVSWDIVTAIFTTSSLVPLVLSIGSLALAVFPRLDGTKGSNVFFGGITKKAENTYLEEMKNLSDNNYENDLLGQIYRNAEIAETKYVCVKRAFIFSFASIPFWLVSIYLLYI